VQRGRRSDEVEDEVSTVCFAESLDQRTRVSDICRDLVGTAARREFECGVLGVDGNDGCRRDRSKDLNREVTTPPTPITTTIEPALSRSCDRLIA